MKVLIKVLIIEDSAEIVEAVSLCLQLRWPEAEISSAAEGNQGISMLETEPADVIILDVNLPDIDGFEVLKRIRSFSNVPVIMLTVRGREDDQARGLEMGADDYIVKPFKPRDLVARVNALIRRSHEPIWPGETAQGTRSGTLSETNDSRSTPDEITVGLTPAEVKLLHLLVESTESTLASERIPAEIRGELPVNREQTRKVLSRLKGKLS